MIRWQSQIHRTAVEIAQTDRSALGEDCVDHSVIHCRSGKRDGFVRAHAVISILKQFPAVIVDNPDGTSQTMPTCVVPAANFNGKAIRTVEGHAKNGELSVLQKAFIEHFAFQCGYCTPGFLNEGQVLLERLAKKPVPRADLEKTIAEALDGHLCRCTGYIKYHEAVRDVILADPGRYLSRA